MAKRTATSELNHDNWDREDEAEEAGTFSKASEEALKKRIIKVAKRRNPISSVNNDEEKTTPFRGFSPFSKTTPTPSNTFGFLSTLTNKTESPKTNGTSEKGTEKPDKNLDEYYAKLKGLNESVTEWIKKHVSSNPFINLQPIFKDYDKYITELEKMKKEVMSEKTEASNAQFSFTTTVSTAVPKFSLGSTSSTSPPKFSFGTNTTTTTSSFSFGSNTSNTATFSSSSSTATVSFSENSFATKPSFSFGNPTTTSSNEKFSFTSTVVKPAETETKTTTEEDQDDEPPKVEFTPVVEEGHIYTIRCKVFVKKDNSFVDHGVGTLYLKPVPNAEKVQLFVRADTNIGNLICNFILSEGIPMQRMGKKDVMLVCVPTPETKPPPVPILLRVKTPTDADELLQTLQKHKK